MERFQLLESLISLSGSHVVGHSKCAYNNTTSMADFQTTQKSDIENALCKLGFSGDHDLWSHENGDKVIVNGNGWAYRTLNGFVRVETFQNMSKWSDN